MNIRPGVLPASLIDPDLLGVKDVLTLYRQTCVALAEEKQRDTLPFATWHRTVQTLLDADTAVARLYWESFLRVGSVPTSRPLQLLTVDGSAFFLFLAVQRLGSWSQAQHAVPFDADIEIAFVSHFLPVLLLLVRDADATVATDRNLLVVETALTVAVHDIKIRAHEFDRLAFLLRAQGSLSSLTPWWSSLLLEAEVPLVRCCEWMIAQLRITRHNQRALLAASTSASRVILSSPPLTRVMGAKKQTVFVHEEDVSGGDVLLHDVHESIIFVSTRCRFLVVQNCHNCRINAGLAQILILTRCTNIQLSGVVRALRISSASCVTLFVHCSTRPVCSGALDRVCFAPYNAFYPDLERDMAQVGISKVNFWSSPLVFLPKRDAVRAEAHSRGVAKSQGSPPSSPRLGRATFIGVGPVLRERRQESHIDAAPVALLPPPDFFPFAFPSGVSGKTDSIPFALPAEYEVALQHARQRALQARRIIDTAQLSTGQRADLLNVVSAKFNEWLETQPGAGALLE